MKAATFKTSEDKEPPFVGRTLLLLPKCKSDTFANVFVVFTTKKEEKSLKMKYICRRKDTTKTINKKLYKQMIRKLFLAVCIAALSVTAWADDTQTVTVGGTTIGKTVQQITFEGDAIVLHFTDGTTEQTDNLSSVKIEFSTASAVRTLNRNNSQEPVYVFDMTGKLVSTMAKANQLDALNKGMYLIKKGKQTVKLIKN